MKLEKPGPERFVLVGQFRSFSDADRINFEHFARICVFEAGQPDQSLKKFLKEKVLLGNCGEIVLDEIHELAKELFTSERSAVYLGQLRGDNCLGFTKDEVEAIVHLLESPDETEKVAHALGYLSPRPRYS